MHSSKSRHAGRQDASSSQLLPLSKKGACIGRLDTYTAGGQGGSLTQCFPTLLAMYRYDTDDCAELCTQGPRHAVVQFAAHTAGAAGRAKEGLTLKRSLVWIDQTVAMESKQRGKGSRSGRTAKEDSAPMWSSRFLWYTYSGWPRTASHVSGRRPWNHSSHSRSGGSRAVCVLQAARTLNLES